MVNTEVMWLVCATFFQVWYLPLVFVCHTKPFLRSEINLWYQKFIWFADTRKQLSDIRYYFWYQKLFYDIRNSNWYQKIISDIRKSNFWYQKFIFWYKQNGIQHSAHLTPLSELIHPWHRRYTFCYFNCNALGAGKWFSIERRQVFFLWWGSET